MGVTGSEFSVGIVGAGHIATVLHMPVIEKMERTRIAYVADIAKAKAERALLGYSGEAVGIDGASSRLPDCDLALITTPVGVRAPYITEFGQRGVPILTEKPFAPDLRTHRKFVDASDTITCNYQYINFSPTRQAARLANTSVFGDLERVEISQGLAPVSGLGTDHYRGNVELSGGGVLVESGCHTFSQLVHIFEDLSVVAAELEWTGNIDVAAKLQLKAASADGQVPIDYRLSMVEPLPTMFRFVFENATVGFDHTDAESVLEITENGEPVTALEPEAAWATSGKEAVYLKWQRFLDDLEEDASDSRRTTMRRVTELLDETYDLAGDRRGLE
jgi:predicted dehydrogenase